MGLILIQTAFQPGSPRLNWESYPREPKEGWLLMDVPAEDVSAFLLGKKFLNGELTDMTPEEAQAQLDEIASMAPPVPGQIITPREFLARFTPAEKTGIYTAAMTDVEVAQVKDEMVASEHIDLCDPDLAAGLDVLVAKSLLTGARKTELLVI
jgi:hypothetical protein